MKYFFGIVTLFFSFLFSNNLQVEQYKLENGMTVMLNEDKEASGVYGVVIVKGGGKPYTIAIVGNREKIDMQKLADFVELIEVYKNDIFN